MLKNLEHTKRKHIFLSFYFVLIVFNFFGQHTYSGQSLEGKTEKELQFLLKEIDQKIKNDPSENQNYYDRILVKTSLGDTNIALKECDQLIKKNPNYWQVYNQRGNILISKGKLKEALIDYETAIQLEPENPSAYNNKGYTFFLLKDYKTSLSFYEIAIKKDSLYTEAYINMINTLYILEDYELLDKISNLLVNKFSTNPKAYIHRAEYYSSQGKYIEALNDYEKAVELDNNKLGVFWIEKLKFMDDIMKDDAMAIKECNKAIASDPKNYLGYYMRSRPEFDLGLYHKVIEDCRTSIKLKPNYNPSYVMRGMAYALLGIGDSAFHDFDKAILLEPNEEEAYIQKTISYIEQQNYGKALATIDAYLMKDPSLKFADIYKPTDIFLQRGNINFMLKKYDEAIKDLKKAVQYSATNAMAWLRLGETYLLQKNNEFACEAFIKSEKLGNMKAKTNRIFNCQ